MLCEARFDNRLRQVVSSGRAWNVDTGASMSCLICFVVTRNINCSCGLTLQPRDRASFRAAGDRQWLQSSADAIRLLFLLAAPAIRTRLATPTVSRCCDEVCWLNLYEQMCGKVVIWASHGLRSSPMAQLRSTVLAFQLPFSLLSSGLLQREIRTQ